MGPGGPPDWVTFAYLGDFLPSRQNCTVKERVIGTNLNVDGVFLLLLLPCIRFYFIIIRESKKKKKTKNPNMSLFKL